MRSIDIERSNIAEDKLLGIHGQASAFVRGDKVSLSLPDRGGANGDLKGLKPSTGCVWQMRFREPMGYRLLGVVPQRDVFVGLLMQPRQNLRWSQEVRRARSIWNNWNFPRITKPVLIESDDADGAFTNWRLA